MIAGSLVYLLVANIVSTTCKLAGIGGYKTNHSLRATAATQLYSSGVDEQLVMERTGHRSTEGVRSYKRTSSEQQEIVSDILSSCKRSCTELQLLPQPLAQPASSASQIVPSTSDVNMVNMPTQQLDLLIMLAPSTLVRVQTSPSTSTNKMRMNLNWNSVSIS